MTVHFTMSGGFAAIPALTRNFSFHTDQLSESEAALIRSMIHQSNFFEQPPSVRPNKGAADFRTYTISVEDGQQSHTIQLVDPVADPALQSLVSKLSSMARASTTHK